MIYKRGKVYWYKFVFNGALVRESSKQGNDKVARQMESAHRTALAKGEVGIREKKPAPILSEFIEKRFEPWAKATFEKASPRHGSIGIEWDCGRSRPTSRWRIQTSMRLRAKPLRVSPRTDRLKAVRSVRLIAPLAFCGACCEWLSNGTCWNPSQR